MPKALVIAGPSWRPAAAEGIEAGILRVHCVGWARRNATRTRMRHSRFLYALCSLPLLWPTQLLGQDEVPCTYATCAVRLAGSDILSGSDARKITSFGFLAAPGLRPWMAVSDSASYYVSVVEDNYVSGEAMSLAGSVLWIGGLLALQGLDDRDQQNVAFAITAAGVILFSFGRARVASAHQAMQSAAWWYNASLENSPPLDARASVPPLSIRGDHARDGTALGLAAGILVGLASTSHLEHDQTAAGVSITAAIAGLGALLGHRIGAGIER